MISSKINSLNLMGGSLFSSYTLMDCLVCLSWTIERNPPDKNFAVVIHMVHNFTVE